MSQSFRLRLLLLALPFILALALLAAVQPVTSAATAVPISGFGRHVPHGRGEPFGGYSRRFGPGASREGAIDHPAAGARAQPPAPPISGFTLDGGRLLAALALSGAFTGLLWLTPDGRESVPLPGPGGSALEQDVVLLRAEVDRLQREQRQLQWTLDWQERLLTEGRQSEHGLTT